MNAAERRGMLINSVEFDKELRSGQMSPLELAPIAKRLGAQGVEYREVYWHDKAKELPAVVAQLRELRLKGYYATFTTLFNRDPEKQARLMQDLEDAHALGSPLMRVFQGERPAEGPEGAQVLEATRRVIDKAGEYGMRLALENFVGIPGGTLVEIQDTLAMLNSPVMGSNIDTSNYSMHGETALDAIKSLGPRVIYAHLKDVRETPEGLKTTYLGNGILPFKEIIAALDATGNDFPFTFEFQGDGDPEGAIAKSIAFLKSL